MQNEIHHSPFIIYDHSSFKTGGILSKKLISYNLKSCKRGFTLLELLISIGIMGLLVGFSSLAYLNVQKNSDLSNQTSQLVNSIRQAQSYAMTGQTGVSHNFYNSHAKLVSASRIEILSASAKRQRVQDDILKIKKAYAAIMGDPPPTSEQLDIGIHFETGKYMLFYGSIYDPEDPRNLTTTLPSNINISIDLPTADLVFSKLSGEVIGYDSNHNTITINHSDGNYHTITVNKLGVVDVE